MFFETNKNFTLLLKSTKKIVILILVNFFEDVQKFNFTNWINEIMNMNISLDI